MLQVAAQARQLFLDIRVRKLSDQGHRIVLVRTVSLPFPPLGISHPNASCAKCLPDSAAIDAEVAPDPSYGPTLLVELDSYIHLSLIPAEATRLDAPAGFQNSATGLDLGF